MAEGARCDTEQLFATSSIEGQPTDGRGGGLGGGKRKNAGGSGDREGGGLVGGGDGDGGKSGGGRLGDGEGCDGDGGGGDTGDGGRGGGGDSGDGGRGGGDGRLSHTKSASSAPAASYWQWSP